MKFFLITCIIFTSLLQAGTPAKNPFEINQDLVNNYIIKKYQKVYDSAKSFHKNSISFCSKPEKPKLLILQNSLKNLLQDWVNISHINFGPASLNLRQYRFFFFPDKHGTGTRQFHKFLIAKDNNKLIPDKFEEISVALQGIQSAEKIIFIRKNIESLLKTSPTDPFLCSYLKAIAGNTNKIAKNILIEWKPIYTELQTKQKNIKFQNEFFATLFQDFYNGLVYTSEIRLKQPYGTSLLKSKPHKVEARYLKASLSLITNSLYSIYEMAFSENNPKISFSSLNTDQEHNKILKNHFKTLFQEINLIKEPLVDSIKNSTERQKIQKAITRLDSLIHYIKETYSTKLGVYIGFNNLDGD